MRHLSLSLAGTVGLLLAAAGQAPAQFQYGVGSYAPNPYLYPTTTAAPTAAPFSGLGHYGLPGNSYYPTYQSYLPYAPTMGATSAAGYSYPVYSITYPNPDGTTTTYQQANIGDRADLRNYYNAGYRGYTAPTPFYSYGQNSLPTAPGYVSYNSPTAASLGSYGNYVTLGAPTAPTASGTMGFGVGGIP